MKKLVALLSLLCMVSVTAKDLLTTAVGGKTITITEIGINVRVTVDGVVRAHSIIASANHRHNITDLVTILENKGALSAFHKAEILKRNFTFKNGVFVEEVQKLALANTPVAPSAALPAGNSGAQGVDGGNDGFQYSGKSKTDTDSNGTNESTTATLLSKVKQSVVDAADYVVSNTKKYPAQTVVAGVVGGVLGFKAGECIAKKFELRKKQTYALQSVTTISGATLATVAVWTLLNRYYKA